MSKSEFCSSLYVNQNSMNANTKASLIFLIIAEFCEFFNCPRCFQNSVFQRLNYPDRQGTSRIFPRTARKISTLKPLTVRIFAAAFSPPKTGNRIFTTLHPAFVRFILAAKPSALARRSLSAFAGLRAPRPRPQTRNRT